METALDEVCGYLKNWFTKPNGIHRGSFTISGGNIDCDYLKPGQYFRIKGSVFNDGVWKYQGSSNTFSGEASGIIVSPSVYIDDALVNPDTEMLDETFVGEIWEMAVPQAVISLVSEIEEWLQKYGGVDSPNMSPYASESFNNYSYAKSSGNSSGNGNTTSVGWADVFGPRLARWRKI